MVYQPHLWEQNKIAKWAVDEWIFSGSDIASAGQPISLGMTGTVFAGSTNATSYGDEGGVYGGAMSSGSGGPSTGRPPQIGRNSIVGPGFNDFDFRVARNIPIYERVHMQLTVDAFNLLNHKIISGVNGSYSTFLTPNSTTGTEKCQVIAAPAGSTQQGCIVPFVASTPLAVFGAATGTNNGLYSARQLEFSAKLFF
jgi:hypothetical protein